MADRKAKATASKAAASKPKAAAAPKRAAAEAVKAPQKIKKAAKPQAAAPVARPKAVAQTVKQTIKKEAETMNKATTQTIEASTVAAERIQAAFGDVNERTKTAIEKSTRMMEEMTELTKGNVEAIVASSKVAARGVEALGQEVAEFGRRSFEEASSVVKSFAEVKSPTDFFRLQSEFAKSQFDSIVAESSRMSETMLKLAGEVIEPLSSRYSVAADRVKNAAL